MMKKDNWRVKVRPLGEWALCPLLLILFLLMVGVVTVANPKVFNAIYTHTMAEKPLYIRDGLMIADGLSGDKSFAEINRSLTRGRIGKREIYHFEDIRNKLKVARGVTIASLAALLLVSVIFAVRMRRVALWALVWYAGIVITSVVWSLINFRHFFRSLHWWIFQDATWILPKNCYSLRLYPYSVWQNIGAVVFLGVLLCLILFYTFLRQKAKHGKASSATVA